MSKNSIFYKIINSQKKGIPLGIYSVCTANQFVIKAALEKGINDHSFVLIESTCNQVNQYGGYSGMKPIDFKNFVYSEAKQIGFPLERLILGGDHLGPNPWRDQSAESAMNQADQLIEEYVLSGYLKIHLDTSMVLGDDLLGRKALAMEVIADRAARLALTAEKAYQKRKKQNTAAAAPVYVIGSEVPIPGGADSSETGLQVTKTVDFKKTVAVFKDYFTKNNLDDAWARVIAVVVQPGVEFDASLVHDYQREQARELSQSLREYPGLVFEAHSTDYQKDAALRYLVEDGFAILKVGPALTFALREALFLLNRIEEELLQGNREKSSNLISTLDAVMVKNPANWKGYYDESDQEIRLARKFSLSDRVRYYWEFPEVKKSVGRLLDNLSKQKIPLSVLSQYMPEQFKKIRAGELKNQPYSLIKDRILNVLDSYAKAVNE